jgi:hypothetical protein
MEIQKNINLYGHLKICLQPDVSVTTNRSRRFKCPGITVTANRAEGLNMSDTINSLVFVRWRQYIFQNCQQTYARLRGVTSQKIVISHPFISSCLQEIALLRFDWLDDFTGQTLFLGEVTSFFMNRFQLQASYLLGFQLSYDRIKVPPKGLSPRRGGRA